MDVSVRAPRARPGAFRGTATNLSKLDAHRQAGDGTCQKAPNFNIPDVSDVFSAGRPNHATFNPVWIAAFKSGPAKLDPEILARPNPKLSPSHVRSAGFRPVKAVH